MTIETYEIVGTVLTIVMAINGWFLKNVYTDMQFIKIELARLITKHDNTDLVARTNTAEIYKMRERLHALEGRDAQFMQYIEDQEKKNV